MALAEGLCGGVGQREQDVGALAAQRALDGLAQARLVVDERGRGGELARAAGCGAGRCRGRRRPGRRCRRPRIVNACAPRSSSGAGAASTRRPQPSRSSSISTRSIRSSTVSSSGRPRRGRRPRRPGRRRPHRAPRSPPPTSTCGCAVSAFSTARAAPLPPRATTRARRSAPGRPRATPGGRGGGTGRRGRAWPAAIPNGSTSAGEEAAGRTGRFGSRMPWGWADVLSSASA